MSDTKSFIARRISKHIIKTQNIHTDDDANKFMDKIADQLSDYDLKRAYEGAKKKYERKPNNSTMYIMNYFKMKCEKRGVNELF